MMKRLYPLLLLLALPLLGAMAQESELRFRADGTFKIAQFTDLHIDVKSPNTEENFNTMRQVIRAERPDFVMLTGDIVVARPAVEGWRMITDFFSEEKIPYAIVLGNHDAEVITKDSIYDLVVGAPYSLSIRGEETIHGHGNQKLQILSSKGSNTAALLYLLDSNQYYENQFVSHYDIIHFDQIAWLRETHSHAVAESGGTPPPSILFFHIPTPEFAFLGDGEGIYGHAREGVSAPRINSGLFSTMLEMGGVMGAFCGHDHENDAVGIYNGIALGYGRITGVHAYGQSTRGGRIFLLHEGEDRFDTWVHTPAEGRHGVYYYPSGFNSDQERQASYLPALQGVEAGDRGVAYRYYTREFKETSQIHNSTPVNEGKMLYPSIKGATQEDHFAYIFESLIMIPVRGLYRFYTYSDDGSVLYIDGQKVVDNDGGHSARLREGEVALEAGLHRLRIDYYEDYMGQELEVGYASKTIKRQPLPAEILYVPSK
ncbi:MAG: metallophosphoesterase [Porphyromonas sp.]|nr:metallophosphoesterase [Porphyromonas sp.]